jgi:hypothetical protein
MTTPTRFTTSCSSDCAAHPYCPWTNATEAKPAAGTVITEMNTPTSAADFADVSDSIPPAPASRATISENGPTW